MPIEIRETIVTPGADSDVVQLRISDAPLDDESATLRLTLLAKLPASHLPLLAQLQREAMRIAQDGMTNLLRVMATEIRKQDFPLAPMRKPPPAIDAGSTEGPEE
jgi:hypothetical protein